MPDRSVPNLREYLTVTQAASLLGVAANTIRAWDAAGKIPSRRNPANGYRLFKRRDLEAFLESIDGHEVSRSVK
jgi:excisionase family DNA binding protein